MTTDKRKYTLIFLDEIIVYLLSFEQHKNHLRAVLKLLEVWSVILRLSKTKLLRRKVKYLGHLFKLGARDIASDMIRVVQEVITQRTAHEPDRTLAFVTCIDDS